MATIKELCKALGVEYNTRNPKRSLAAMRQDYVIEENGFKKGDYIYVRDLSRVEKIGLTKVTDCKKLVKEMLYLKLSQERNNTIRADIKDYLVSMGVVNKYYNTFGATKYEKRKIEACNNMKDPHMQSKFQCIYIDELDEFHDASYSFLRSLMKDAIDELEKERLIYSTKIMKCVCCDYTTREMDKDEIEAYLDATKTYMENLPYEVKRWEEVKYFDKIKINQNAAKDCGFINVYNAYEIVLNRNGIKREASNLTMTELKQKLNSEVADKLLRSKANELSELEDYVRLSGIDHLILIN